ncbi:CPBP family glutamic-type intramembrane protease [Parasphingorhabdus sp.]
MAYTLTQTWLALKAWPEMKRWRSAFGLAVPTLLFIAGIGYLSGWITFAPVSDAATIFTAVGILFFLPALFEELVFRGFLLAWLTTKTARWSAWISTLLFVLWHPLQALTIGPPWASVFLQPSFLFATFLLGIILSHIRIVSGSLWPVVMIHWFAAVVWKLVLGGPFY